jgi:hypothetical protein
VSSRSQRTRSGRIWTSAVRTLEPPLEAPLRLGMSSRAVDELRPIDVAHYLGVSGQRVSQLASEQGFPRPRHRADGTRFWRADVNEQWAERRWWGSKPWRT